jgi:hypothetical protein
MGSNELLRDGTFSALNWYVTTKNGSAPVSKDCEVGALQLRGETPSGVLGPLKTGGQVIHWWGKVIE